MSNRKHYGTFAEYAQLAQEMDLIYGGPNYKNKKLPPGRFRGRDLLVHIFQYLSKRRNQTCEEMAEYVLNQRDKTGAAAADDRKLKAVTDDIRKFIINNLLSRKLVRKEGFEKKHNKKIQKYSLDYNGVLYAIHLLSKNTHDDDNLKIMDTHDESVIQDVANTYPEYLPFVFDRLDVFKSILGEGWLHYTKIHEIADNGITAVSGPIYGKPASYDFLNDFVVRSAFILSRSISSAEMDMSKMTDIEKQNIIKLDLEGKLSIVKNFDSLSVWYNHRQKPNAWTNIPLYLKKVSDPWGIAITLIVYNNVIGRLLDEWLGRVTELYDDSEHVRKDIVKKSREIFKEEPDFAYWYWKFVIASVSDMNKINKEFREFQNIVGALLP